MPPISGGKDPKVKTWARSLPLVLVVVTSSLAVAEAPKESLRPELRAGSGTQPSAAAAAKVRVQTSATAQAPSRSLRPELRTEQPAKPATGTTSGAGAAAPAAAATAASTVPKSEKKKSGGLFAKRKMRKGSVCGDVGLQGDSIGNVAGAGACGVPNAVKVRSVSGVALSTPSIMNCETAKALKTWVDDGVIPAFKRRGKVVELKVAAHYSCRTRNNKAGAKLSEHAKGNAIDISGFTMKDGQVYTVEASWWRGRGKKPIRKAYKKACGPFGTTLGPNADKYHHDHFHLDTARYRSGPFCK